ncbi:hypothetical protein K435DRAFT_864329 [Dendrothele bispora CBS 962.96]|uniref:Uncharacterized protein n=1 Tax=Dendrothele bispora (strain CBS 962.96) TaxID=1314807 RepID=A0A4S8LNP9_DENBC|nr:hypothetical protein K435DRAFT_864329 [Dendrothele bispora CBS 962.96]
MSSKRIATSPECNSPHKRQRSASSESSMSYGKDGCVTSIEVAHPLTEDDTTSMGNNNAIVGTSDNNLESELTLRTAVASSIIPDASFAADTVSIGNVTTSCENNTSCTECLRLKAECQKLRNELEHCLIQRDFAREELEEAINGRKEAFSDAQYWKNAYGNTGREMVETGRKMVETGRNMVELVEEDDLLV